MRRVRELALDALGRYDFDVARCSFVSTGFNTVFRIETTTGSTYALRVSPNLRIHADSCELVETAWVAALRHDTHVAVPEVITANDGSPVVWADAPGVPGARSCVLFDWVRGQPLRERLRAELARKTGEMTAALHEHGARYLSDPPAGALPADRVLYFLCERRLDDLRPEYGSLLDDAVSRAQRVLDDLWQHPPHRPHLLHGDLQPGNVMVHRNDVTLIDFQDLIWGFEVQDVVIALQGLAHRGDTGACAEAFRAGYESVRPWPDAEPATLAALNAARRLNVLNFGLNLRGADLDAFVARNVAPIAKWMKN
jgi:Ser/Thr protein kinase RdoA (MazF antagonist)